MVLSCLPPVDGCLTKQLIAHAQHNPRQTQWPAGAVGVVTDSPVGVAARDQLICQLRIIGVLALTSASISATGGGVAGAATDLILCRRRVDEIAATWIVPARDR